jgi:large subunit ribosomal protein L20
MRVKTAVPRHRRLKRLKKATKGFHGGRRRLRRTMKDAIQRSMAQAFRGRKEKKRQYRSLWIVRINAACRERGLTYGRLVDLLKKKGVALDRKALAWLAMNDSAGFDAVVATVRG